MPVRRDWPVRPWLAMSAAAVTAAVVRLPFVYSRPFWEDEVASARILVQPTFVAMLRRVAQTESTPPLWYTIAWLVHRFGVPLQSERLLSVAFGAALAAALVSLAHRFVELPLATVAGLMTALGTEFVLHGAELRAYELFALLSVFLGVCVLGLLERASRRWEIAVSATVAAGCLTHYFFALSVVAVLGWLWLDPGAREIRRRATLAVFVGAAPAAAWIPVMMTQYRHGRFDWIGSFRWRTVAGVPLRLFTYAYSVVPVGPAVSALAIIFFATGSVLLVRTSSTGRLMVLLATFPLVAAAGLWAGGIPIFDLRNLIGIGPYLAVLTVAVVDSLSHRLTSVVVPLAIVGALALSLATSNAERIPAYDLMAHSLVQQGWSVSQPILVFGDPYRYRLPFEWYLPTNPVLHMSQVLAGACKQIFVVSPTGRVRREQLRPAGAIDRRLRGVTLLFDPAHRPHCVSLTPGPAASQRDMPDRFGRHPLTA